MAKFCHTECTCRRCERLGTGVFAYREIAEDLGTDEDDVIYPLWKVLCAERMNAVTEPKELRVPDDPQPRTLPAGGPMGQQLPSDARGHHA